MSRVLKGLVVGLAIGMMLVPSAASAGGGCHNPTVADAVGTKIEMRNACFTPTVLRTEPGATVTWTNQDEFTHVVSGVGWAVATECGGKRCSFVEFAPGQSASVRFDQPGAYPYSCYLHPSMNGVVIVGDGRGDPDASAVQAQGASAVTVRSDASVLDGEKASTLVSSRQKPGDGLTSTTLLAAIASMAVAGSVGFTAGRLLNRRPE